MPRLSLASPLDWCFQQLSEQPTLLRRLAVMALDSVMLLFASWLSYAIRFNAAWPSQIQPPLFAATALLGPLVFLLTRQYRSLTRYSGQGNLLQLAGRNALLVLLLMLLCASLGWTSRSAAGWFLFWILAVLCTGMSRQLVRNLMVLHLRQGNPNRRIVLIYGTNALAIQLAAAIRLNPDFKVVGFVDDEPDLWHRQIFDLPIYSPDQLAAAVQKHRVQQVLVADPLKDRSRRRLMLAVLQQHGVALMAVPSLQQIVYGEFQESLLRPIAIEDLVGRDEVEPREDLLRAAVQSRTVLITGAGGSIGSELARQIARLGADRLLLLDHSEAALFSIEQDLRQHHSPCPLVPILGSVSDRRLLHNVFQQWPVHTVFHCAAYKHVPMVETNPLAGLFNNVFGTQEVVRAAVAHGVERLLLISSDKAVRPTGVMGASKRLAELVVQAEAVRQHHSGGRCRLGMVRFGNVIGSSGSVVPMFQQQISAGGPITVTHPEICRYFMTIPEAVQLLLQAASLLQGQEVFLLDMGEPVRIEDLARNLIGLAGLSVRDATNPHGDIAITYTGLRPGEKLYEELLVDQNAEATLHPLIYRAREQAPDPALIDARLKALKTALLAYNETAARALLAELVPEWTAATPAADPAAAPAPNPLRSTGAL